MIKLRGSTWYVRITRRDDTGRKVQKWISLPDVKNEHEARREEARLIAEIDSEIYVPTTKLTVAMLLEQWLIGVKADVRVCTWKSYEGYVRRNLIPQLGRILLSKLTATQIRTAYARLRESGRADGQGGLSEQTVLHCHRVLDEALKQAVNDGLIAKNPADAVKAPTPAETEIEVIDEERAMKLLEASEGTLLYLPILLAITTGLRRSEVLAIQWEDIDLERGTLSVKRRAERIAHKGLDYGPPKSKTSKRTILLLPMAIEALRRHRVEQAKRQKEHGEVYLHTGWVITTAKGNAMSPEYLTHTFPLLLTKKGLPHMRFHDLRHSHASLLIKYGTPMKAISARLGHSNIGVTMDTYGHLLPGVEEEAVKRLESSLQDVIKVDADDADSGS